MKNTLLGGILFLIPLAIVSIVLGKAYQIGLIVAQPLDHVIPVENIAGVALVNILAIVLIMVVCFIAGLAARGGLFSAQVAKVDGILIDVLPAYAVAKGMIGSVREEDDIASHLTPVLVRFDDYHQVAFELERDETHATVFLPGAPSAWSGTAVVVEIDRVRLLNISTLQAARLFRSLGRGTLSLRETA